MTNAHEAHVTAYAPLEIEKLGTGMLEAALTLATEYDLPLFPCRRHTETVRGKEYKEKSPYTLHGFKDASRDVAQIEEWWRLYPDALIGVPTGRCTGLLVLDVDPDGAEWYREHSARLSCNRTHQTKRGGFHVLYRRPTTVVRIGNSASELAPGIDIRGDGGYIIWWPADGFEVTGDLADLAAPPQWLLEELLTLEATRSRPTGQAPGSESGGETLREGRRSDYLSGRAFGMRHLGLSSRAVLAALRVVNEERCDPPLPDAELTAIVAGKQKVRQFEKEPANILHQRAVVQFVDEDVPEVVARAARAYSKASGIAFELCVASALACIGAATGDNVRLCVSAGSVWYEAPRLWWLPIADSGAGKSPAAKQLCHALHEIEMEERERHDSTLAAQAQEAGERVPQLRLITHDSTLEALSDVLEANPRGLLYMVDEFDSWFGGIDAYRSGGSRDRGYWMKLCDGGPNTVDRVMRGAVFVKNWGVTLLTACTPTVLQKYAGKLPEDGLLQRFIPLMCEPKGRRGEGGAQEELQALSVLARSLYDVSRDTDRIVHMHPDAERAFREFEQGAFDLVPGTSTVNPGLAAHIAKTPGLCARLALVFHAARCSAQGPSSALSRDTMEQAVRFMLKARQHAFAMYAMLAKGEDDPLALARVVARWLLTTNESQVERRDVGRHVTKFRKANDRMRDRAMEVLESLGWVLPAPSSYDKGHVTRWDVNPKIFTRFKAEADAERERRRNITESWLAAKE